MIDFSPWVERGCYRQLGTLEEEAAGDWLATATPKGGAYRHTVATAVLSRSARHQPCSIRLVCAAVKLFQFTQRRRAVRIGTHRAHLFALGRTSKSGRLLSSGRSYVDEHFGISSSDHVNPQISRNRATVTDEMTDPEETDPYP